MDFYIPKTIKKNSISIGVICGGAGKRLAKINKNKPKLFTTIKKKKNFYDLFLKQKLINTKLSTVFFTSDVKNEQNSIVNVKNFFLICEKKRIGTGGSLLRNLKYFKKNIIILYGDIFFEDDLIDILNHHKKNKNDITIHVHKKENISDVNLLKLNNNFSFKSIIFNKKKKYKNVINLCLGGIYIFNKNFLLNFVKKNNLSSKNFDLEENLFKKRYLKNYKIDYFFSSKYLKDFGTYERLLELKKYLKFKKFDKKIINYYFKFNEMSQFKLNKIRNDILNTNNFRFNYLFKLNLICDKISERDKFLFVKKIDSYLLKKFIYLDVINFINK